MNMQTTLSFERKFKVTYNGGRMNGAKRYFKTLSGATLSAKSYIHSNKDLPEYIYCEIESLILYQGRLQKKTFIKEIDNKHN